MTENGTHDLPNCKDFLAQIGPIDTLLGSVSYNEIDNTDGKPQQLRTSARVFKKMKFDLSVSAALEKSKEKKEEVKPEEVKPEVKKYVSTLWISEEKKMFFEALNEFGKDFESIHSYICTRLKKKGIPDDQLKTKPQIRHFYYKTFHMLSGNLKFNEKVPKNVQELYTLINYGELRKKVGSVSKKCMSRVGELINNGYIALRVKGKMIKVKTPMCRALRRLNQLDEKYDDLKLPTRVLVELRPKDMVSFLKVQSIAQNPRIKVALALQKRLSSLITCMNTRWKSSEAVVYDKAVISTNPITKDRVPEQKVIDENSLLLNPLLRLSPPPDAHVELPSIDISEYFTGQSISLRAFEMRKGVRTQEEIKKEEPDIKTEKSPTKPTNDEIISGESAKTSVNKSVNEAVNTILSLQETHTKIDSKNDSKNNIVKVNPKDVPLEEKKARISQIREGWTVETCGSLTIGELYLMFGVDSRLVLEYNWDPLKVKSQDDEITEDCKISIKKENSVKISMKKENDLTNSPKKENDLTNSLKKLLSLAKLHSTKPVVKCSCGHVCGVNTTSATTSSKSTPQFKKPATTKVVKKTPVVHEKTAVEEKLENTNANPPPVVKEQPNDDFEEDRHFLATTNSVVQFMNQRDSINKLNRARGRSRYKQLVVERKLVPNKSESKHQIVTMNIVSQDNTPSVELNNKGNSDDTSNNSGLPSLLRGDTKVDTGKVVEDTCVSEKSFSGFLDDNPSSNLSGISKILKENENQWINSDVADYSLSSLLGHLDCPTKNEDTQMSQLSQDVDAQLRTLLIETSVDYTAKFADLAAQVVDNKK